MACGGFTCGFGQQCGYTLALKTDGSLWAWGDNSYGQLGNGNTLSTNQPTQVGTDRDWTAVASGHNHALALKSDGSLWAWGSNSHGQLGTGTLNNTNQPVRIGSDTNWGK